MGRMENIPDCGGDPEKCLDMGILEWNIKEAFLRVCTEDLCKAGLHMLGGALYFKVGNCRVP